MTGGFRKKLGLSVSGWRNKMQGKTQDRPKTNYSIAPANSSEGTNSAKPCFPTDKIQLISLAPTVTPLILRSTINSPETPNNLDITHQRHTAVSRACHHHSQNWQRQGTCYNLPFYRIGHDRGRADRQHTQSSCRQLYHLDVLFRGTGCRIL